MMMNLNLYGLGNNIENDTIRPLITAPAVDLTVECGDDYVSELNVWYNISGGAQATDNSGEVSIESTIALSTIQDSLTNSLGAFCNPENIFEVGFYALDTCGNTSIDTSFARFQIIDTQRPNLQSRASSVVLHCDDSAQDSLDNWVMSFGGAIAIDECSPTVDWFRIIWNDNKGNSSIGHPTDGPFIPIDRENCGWEVTVSFFVRDVCGNNQITTASFSLTDTIAPQFIDPQVDVEVACNDILAGIVVSDNCNENIIPVFEDISSTRSADSTSCEFYNYTLNRLWTVTDDCGNSSSFEQMISVVDTIIPSFVVPPDITVFCSDDTETTVTGFPTDVSDNCNPNPLVIFTDSGESEGCDLVISRFWQIADGCGSSNIVPQQITVVDTIRPTITATASDLLLSCEDPDSLALKFDTWLGNIGGASAQDACGSVDWFAAVPGSYDIDDSSTFPGELINSVDDVDCGSAQVVVDFVFIDACDNAAVTSATFALEDTIAPVFDEPFEDIILEADSSCMANTIMIFPQVSDNCVQDSQVVKQIRLGNIFISVPEGRFDTLLRSGVYDFAYLIADCSGNSDSVVSTITILDNIAPTLACPSDTVAIVNSSTCVAEIRFPLDFLIKENCAIESISYQVSGSTSTDLETINTAADSFSMSLNVGANIVEYIARDESGNRSTCSFSVEVSDAEMQDIECRNETIFLPISSAVPFVLSDSVFIENLVDNCLIDSIFVPIMSLTCDQVGETIGVQLTIFDRAGSSQNCTSILKVEVEEINPSYENKFCTSDTLKLFSNLVSDGDLDQNVYSWTGPNNYASSISDPILTQVDSSFAGMYVLSVTGEAGCSQTDTVMVMIESFETPLISSDQGGTCAGDTINFRGTSYDFSVLYNWYEGLFPDGNLIDTSSVNQISFVPAQAEQDYYLIVEKDDCTSLPSNSIRVVSGDIVAPTIICPRDTTISIDSMSCLANFELPTDYTVSDNCGFADTIILKYSIEGEGVIINDSMLMDGIGDIDSLIVNNYQATYSVNDLSANSDSCSFMINIVDNIAPQLICKNDSIQLSLSQLNNFRVADLDILVEANDNCQLDTIIYTPDNLVCDRIAEQQMVSMRATDISGNISECDVIVTISLDTLMVSFESGICPGDTLRLRSNITDTVGLEFEWTGPSGFVSNEIAPTIDNPSIENNGSYRLFVGSDGSCFKSAEIEVEVANFATPFITTNSSIVCETEQLELRTQNYGGNIRYSWYQGDSLNGTLISEVNEPTLVLSPGIGAADYYVIINNEDCASAPSESINIEVVEMPVVSITVDSIFVCDGETFNLSLDNINNSLDYEWIGPNGYSATEGNPAEELIASQVTEGIYQVISKVGSCTSDTASVVVSLDSSGSLPVIQGETNYCEGSVIQLIVENIPDATNYTWLLDGEVNSTTPDNSLLIINAGQQFAGEWRVFVEGACSSDTSAVLAITISEELNIAATSNSPVCGSSSLQLEVTAVSGASYVWEGPGGFTSNERSPVVESIAGQYSVTVTANETCESVATTEVEIKGRPTIQGISSNIQPCGTSEMDLRLTPIIDANETYTYEWSGPNGFSSSDEIVVIEDFTIAQEGVFTLMITNGECESLPSNIVISTGEGIDTPVITSSREVCIGQSIVISVEGFSDGINEFIWTTPQGEIRTDEPSLTVNNSESNDSGEYELQVVLGDCISEASEPIVINVGAGLEVPRIISAGPFCSGETIQLEVEFEDGEYEWRGPNDFEAFDANPVIFNISEIFVGGYEVRAIGDDCASPWSEIFDLQLVEIPTTPIPTLTADGLCQTDTTAYDLCIEESTLMPGADYVWINASSGDTIGTTVGACLSVFIRESFVQGINNINVIASIGSCRSDMSSTVTITVTNGEGGELTTVAGEDISACDDGVSLGALLAQGEIGSWSSPDAGIVFDDMSAPNSMVTGLEEGENILIWTVTGENCSGMGSDTVSIFYAFEPILEDDDFEFVSGQQIVFDPLENDELPADFTIEIVSISDGENTDASDPRAVKVGVEDGYGGEIEVVYEVCNSACPELCVQAMAILTIEGQTDCIATTLITPNGDGLNDNFEIPCLDSNSFPSNRLTIYNQWGDEVYAAQPYDNNWQGTFNNEDLPVGTYFFILDLGEGLRLQDGFIQLER